MSIRVNKDSLYIKHPDTGEIIPLDIFVAGDALLKSGGSMEGPINMNGQMLFGLNAPTEDTQAANKAYVDAMIGKVYPVGSIYMSAVSTSPASLFGGTWERLKDRFLLAAGDTYNSGTTGGEAAHTLSIEEMPTHSHAIRQQGTDGDMNMAMGKDGPYNGVNLLAFGTSIKAFAESTIFIDYSGGSQPHNNMPPYLAVYMWKRVA